MPTIVPRPVPVRMARERSSTPPSPQLLTVPRNSGVARCLFGAPDPKDVMEFARDEIQKEQRRLAEKYNFDFETDTPLVGNFVYEPIDDVPACLQETSNSPKRIVEDVAQRKLTGKDNMQHTIIVNSISYRSELLLHL